MDAPKTTTPDWNRLSRSSKAAFGWAAASARKSSPQDEKAQYSKSYDTPPVVDALDILAGIILSHGNSSEPLVIFDYLGLSVQPLYQQLEKSNKLNPEDAGKSAAEKLDQFPELTDEARTLVEKAFELDARYDNSKEDVVELRYLFGGLLLTDNAAKSLLKTRWQGGAIATEALIRTYPRFLESGSNSYRQFLESTHPLSITHFDSDTTTSEDDLVGIGHEVNAFAYLMASTSLKPPLAIGLFGNWGSGKSFFMTSLQKRIDKITEDARNSQKLQKDIDIYKHVVQIEFNAWHYVESDLWASMVDHIFRNLRMHGKEKPNVLKERQDELIRQLRDAKQEKDVAAQRKKALEDELKKKQQDLDKLLEARTEKLKALKQLQEEDIIKAIHLTEEDKKNYHAILDKLGLTTAGDSAADFLAAFDELKQTWQRGSAFVQTQSKGPWYFTLMLMVILVATPLIGYLLKEGLATLDKGFDQSIVHFFSTLSTLLTLLAGYIRYANSWVLGKLKKAEQAREDLLERYEREKAAFEHKMLEAEKELAEAEKELETARKDEEQIRNKIRDIQYQLEIVPIQLLRGFVDERSQSKDYRDRLGLMALVRRDFEHLSNLIEIQNKALKEQDQPENKEIINRIVLYIDDLDRCPPEKVIEVLQAVHLLLAFPLFVVMVAVDSRWLSTSLQNHYRELLTLNVSEANPLNHFHQASPHDYLEKIFQIPFWINPLVEEARMRIVQGLLGESVVSTKKGGKEGSSSWQTVAAPSSSTTGRDYHALAKDLETNFKPQSLAIQEEELNFIHDLQMLLGESPRSVKRFVNVYRLIKAIALTFEPDFNQETDFAPYKLNLFLLCVVTGLPAMSRRFFNTLQAAFEQSPDPQHGALNTLEDMLGHLSNYCQSIPADVTAFKDEYERLSRWLEQYQGGSWKQLELEKFRPWARQVARFSYQVEIFR